MNDKNIVQMPDGYLNKTPLFQFILLSCLFPLWGCAAALNDILITQFKSVFSLSNFASALVQSAFYGGYFLIAIPASLVIKKTSYKVAILIGLTLYIVGCTLFFPASHMATYTMFLAAIFAIAIGLSFLETAANTYSSMIGPKAYATLRLNISQTFYPIGAAINDWGNLYMSETLGVDLVTANTAVSMFELGGFIGALVAGWGSDKLFNGNRGPMNLIFAAGILLSVGSLWLMPFASYVMQAACFFTTGFFVFGPQMLIGMAAAECSHKEAAGAATGFVGLFAYLGASLSGWPLAKVLEIWHWTGFFAVIAIAAGISALLLLPFLNAQAPRETSEA